MKQLNNNFLKNEFIKLHQEEEFDNLRYSGNITSKCLMMLESLVIEGTAKTLIELDKLAEEFFLDNKTTPVFKGYRGFPNACCISTNFELVHSIPKDYRLQEGDLVSFDTGCNYKGSLSDSALTCVFGNGPKQKELALATQECLYAAIKSINKNKKIGIIGNTIFHTARKKGFKVIENYTGHGISDTIHAQPTVKNNDDPEEGVRFQTGMVLAIEPLLVSNKSSTETSVGSDNWTVSTRDISAHYEHSILITKNKLEILTHRQNEKIDAVFNLS